MQPAQAPAHSLPVRIMNSLAHALSPLDDTPPQDTELASVVDTATQNNTPTESPILKQQEVIKRLQADCQRLQQELFQISRKSLPVIAKNLPDEDLVEIVLGRQACRVEVAIRMSDKEIFEDVVIVRPQYREFLRSFDKEDLHLAQTAFNKFRETLQLRINLWKDTFGITVSLMDEVQEEAKAQPTSTAELIQYMGNKIQADLQSILGQLDASIKKLRADLDARGEELLTREEQFRGVSLNVAHLKQNLQKAQEAKLAVEREKADLEATLTKTENSKTELKSAANPLEDEVAKQKRDISELKAKNEELKAELRQKYSTIANLKVFEQTTSALQDNYQIVDATLAKSKEKNAELTRQNIEYRERISKLEANMVNIVSQERAAKEHAQSVLAVREAENEKLKLELDALKRKAVDYNRLEQDYTKAIEKIAIRQED